MKQRILSILVDNTAGVLGRIAGMFSRRGYNIDSLTVGVTADPRYSRMTVVCSGDDDVLEQITKQLNKLVDVVLELTGSKSKLEAFLQLLADGNEILELARTGVSGLSRGSDYVLVL